MPLSPCHKVTVFFLAFQNMPENGRQGKHVSMGTGNAISKDEWTFLEWDMAIIHSFKLDETPLGQLGVWGVASGGTQGPHIIPHSLGTYWVFY